MFKFLIQSFLVICLLTTSLGFATCSQTVEVGVGWRRDHLKWRVKGLGLDESCINANVKDRLLFKDVDMYMLTGKARWVDYGYFIRLAADYALSDKGRAKERFRIESPILDLVGGELATHDSYRVKRRSEAYNFNAAVGYPFTYCACRLNVIPMIGYSYHRQRLRTKNREDSDSSFCSCFSLSSSNPFLLSSSYDSCSCYSYCFDPFSSGSCSSESIASLLGFSAKCRTSVYRFTWYGPYLGFDLAYALDPCWSLFSELEYHFFDRCNRKRKSHTAVSFVDDYHAKGRAYGFNGTIGTSFYMSNCWYSTIAVEYKWWKSVSHKHGHRLHHCGSSSDSGYYYYDGSRIAFRRYEFSSSSESDEHSRRDKLVWISIAAYITLGYMF